MQSETITWPRSAPGNSLIACLGPARGPAAGLSAADCPDLARDARFGESGNAHFSVDVLQE